MTTDAAQRFEAPEAGAFRSSYLGRVVAVNDPQGLGRVQVRLLSFDGVAGQDASIWARVAVPFAGESYGAFMLPAIDEEVLVTFVNGDPRMPVVVGSLWNGSAAPPESLPGDDVDRWTVVGRAGTRIAVIEERGGDATISLTTPGGVSAVMKQSAGGSVEVKAAGATLKIDSGGIKLSTPAKLTVEASTVEVTAGQVTVNAAMSKFAGVVMCDVLQATTVISTTYTPGAGNIW